MNFRRLYNRGLGLYPKDYQYRFAAEMRMAFAARLDELEENSQAAGRLILSELVGLLRGAACE